MRPKFQPLFNAETGFLGGGGGGAAQAAAAPAVAAPAAGAVTPAAGTPTPGTFTMDGFADASGKFAEGAFSVERLKAMGIEGANPENLQKYGTVPELIKALINKDKLVGAKGVILPVEGSPPEVLNEYRRQMGIPNTPEEYKLKPDTLPEGVVWNDAEASEYAKILHEQGVSQAAARKLSELQASKEAARSAAANKDHTDQVVARWQVSDAWLKAEYGDSVKEQHAALVDYAGTLQDLDMKNPMDKMALSLPWVVRLLDESHRGLKEAPLPNSGGAPNTGGNMSYLDKARAIKLQDPKWRSNPGLVKQVETLYAQHDAREKRTAGR